MDSEEGPGYRQAILGAVVDLRKQHLSLGKEPGQLLRTSDGDRVCPFATWREGPGIWRDLAVRKRKTEVDAQVAIVADLGGEAGVETPALRRLVALIHAIENEERPLAWSTLDEMLSACT